MYEQYFCLLQHKFKIAWKIQSVRIFRLEIMINLNECIKEVETLRLRLYKRY